jgi:DNA-binding PadR family transcriptional regulator
LDEPVDDRQERIKALQDQINAIKQKQKEDQLERIKAFREHAEAIKQLKMEEQLERRKALLELAEAKRQKQRMGKAGRGGLMGHIADKIDEAQESHLELHRQRDIDHISNRIGKNRKQIDFLPDHGDQDLGKGFLKLHILGILKERPAHGYEIIHVIEHHTNHRWHPSPGSLYPALESLESKGFISCIGDGRRKVYSLTPRGETIIADIGKKREEQFLEMKAFMSSLLEE